MARGCQASAAAISAPVSGCRASSVNNPSSTAESNAFEPKKPMPTCMICDGSGLDIFSSRQDGSKPSIDGKATSTGAPERDHLSCEKCRRVVKCYHYLA